MGFRVALDLGDLHDGFEFPAAGDVVGVEGGAPQARGIEHEAFGHIGVVGDGEEVRPGGRAGFLQPGPQVLGIHAVQQAEGLEGLRRALVAVHQHHPVQVGGTGHGAPFPADESGEFAGPVVLVGKLGLGAPGIDAGLGHGRQHAGVVAQARGAGGSGTHVAGRRQRIDEDVHGGVIVQCPVQVPGREARLEGIPQAQPSGVHPPLVDGADDTQVFGVVGNHQEIQRRPYLYPRPVIGVDDRLAHGVAVGRVGIRGVVVVHVGVGRVAGMQVGVAPQQLFVGRPGVQGQRQGGGEGEQAHRGFLSNYWMRQE